MMMDKALGDDEPLASAFPPTRFMLHQECFLMSNDLPMFVEGVNDRRKEAEEERR